MGRFIEGQDRHQQTLLPESLDEFVAEDNAVRVIDAFVGELALGGCEHGQGADSDPSGRHAPVEHEFHARKVSNDESDTVVVGWNALMPIVGTCEMRDCTGRTALVHRWRKQSFVRLGGGGPLLIDRFLLNSGPMGRRCTNDGFR